MPVQNLKQQLGSTHKIPRALGNIPPVAIPDPSLTPSLKQDSALVTTPELEAFGLQFNTEYKLIICESCQVGLPFDSITNHFNNPPQSRTQFTGGEWKFGPFSTRHITKIGSPALNTIILSLVSHNYIQEESDIRRAKTGKDWNDLPTPLAYVAGIRVFENVYQCGCGYVCATLSTMKSSHKPKCDHNNRNQLTLVIAQTLCELKGFTKYFVISHNGDMPQEQVPAINPPLKETAADRLRRKMAPMTTLHDISPEDDVRRVLPVYVNLRIHTFFRQYDRTKIWQPFLRDKTNQLYKRLQKVVVKSFSTDVERIDSLNHSLLVRMTNCTP